MLKPVDTLQTFALSPGATRPRVGDGPEGLREAARQFEALLLNMMLKGMRQTTTQDGPLDSEETRMVTAMLDTQLSQSLSARGIGLADALFQQLSRFVAPHGADGARGDGGAGQPGATGATGATGSPATVPAGAIDPGSPAAQRARAFRDRLMPHALEASRATGIPADLMIGQAALETGWGRHEIRAADGTPSHNLFGIKATGGWKGRVQEAATTEFVDGERRTVTERFRAYDSYADAFRDYAELLRTHPRYRGVLAAGDATVFAEGLQRAGYATDPDYAAKLIRTIRQLRTS